ncbi:MAG: hypothetical protein QXH87_00285, partial [Candidatus Bathyarchaeia archaeon]
AKLIVLRNLWLQKKGLPTIEEETITENSLLPFKSPSDKIINVKEKRAMTKQGYTHIIVPKNLHDQLKILAQQNNISISQLINRLINISINVSLNISINTVTLNQQKISIKKAPNIQNNPEQALFKKREGMETAGCHRIVRLPGFERNRSLCICVLNLLRLVLSRFSQFLLQVLMG